MKKGVPTPRSTAGLGFLAAAALLLAALPAETQAKKPGSGDPPGGPGGEACPVCSSASSSADFDRDGLNDRDEACSASMGRDGDLPPPCTDTSDPDCTDPCRQNVFLCFQPAAPSLFDELALPFESTVQTASDPVSAGGLDLILNFIDCALLDDSCCATMNCAGGLPVTPTNGPRCVNPTKAAVRVAENRELTLHVDPTADSCPGGNLPSRSQMNPLGKTFITGTAQDWSGAEINTGVIEDFFNCLVNGDDDVPSTDSLDLMGTQLPNTVLHEVFGHDQTVVQTDNPAADPHYSVDAGCIVAPTECSKKGPNVRCTIPDQFCTTSQEQATGGVAVCGNFIETAFGSAYQPEVPVTCLPQTPPP